MPQEPEKRPRKETLNPGLKRMSTATHGTSPPAIGLPTTVLCEKNPGSPPAPLQRQAVRKEAARPQEQQGGRSFRLTLLLMVPIPLAALVGAFYYARSQKLPKDG